MAKSIVVADDDPDILSIVAMSLETQGYDVFKAANGREAVDLARDHHPDLIILDMMMPVMSGYDVVAVLKANPVTAAIPVVGISAKAAVEDIGLASDLGVDAYIRKPFRIAQVLQMIEAYI
jgi:CheY-like chemotaxis protein